MAVKSLNLDEHERALLIATLDFIQKEARPLNEAGVLLMSFAKSDVAALRRKLHGEAAE